MNVYLHISLFTCRRLINLSPIHVRCRTLHLLHQLFTKKSFSKSQIDHLRLRTLPKPSDIRTSLFDPETKKVQHLQLKKVIRLIKSGTYLAQSGFPNDSTFRVYDLGMPESPNPSKKRLKREGHGREIRLITICDAKYLRISLRRAHNFLQSGDRVEFHLRVTNNKGKEAKSQLIDATLHKRPDLRPDVILAAMPKGTTMLARPCTKVGEDTQMLAWAMQLRKALPAGVRLQPRRKVTEFLESEPEMLKQDAVPKARPKILKQDAVPKVKPEILEQDAVSKVKPEILEEDAVPKEESIEVVYRSIGHSEGGRAFRKPASQAFRKTTSRQAQKVVPRNVVSPKVVPPEENWKESIERSQAQEVVPPKVLSPKVVPPVENWKEAIERKRLKTAGKTSTEARLESKLKRSDLKGFKARSARPKTDKTNRSIQKYSKPKAATEPEKVRVEQMKPLPPETHNEVQFQFSTEESNVPIRMHPSERGKF